MYPNACDFEGYIQKSSLERLHRLRHALTENRSISHYAALSDCEVQSVLQSVDAALGLLGPKHRKQHRRRRAKKASLPLEMLWRLDSALFGDESRWPRRPYCTNDLAAGLRIRSLRQAITMTHIQCNRPNQCAWIIFDIDRPDAENAWRQAGLSEPTWTAVNNENGHAHAVYGLRVPVLMGGLGVRNSPVRYLASVEAMMREKLKADQSYSGLITKNPMHTKWRVLHGPQLTYDLSELAVNLPGIEKYKPKRRDLEVGVGRNVTLFDRLRKWAYREIRPFWGQGLGGWNQWLSLCNNRAVVLNFDFSSPLGGKEVWHLARSVAKYVWKYTTKEGFSEWQAVQGTKGGKASGLVRRMNSVTAAAPWKTEGISRSTWYRRKQWGNRS